MTLAGELARRIAGTSHGHLTAEAIRGARIGILDTIGVTLAGAREQATRIAAKIAGAESGPCVVFGAKRRASCLAAAFVNGIAANVLDFDDCTDHLGGHPSAPVLPALFALGEQRGAVGRDVLTAYVVGFEVETQLGRGVNFHHYEKGWHPTATLGVFGAGAACAHLMRLPAEQTATTLALCASMAAGIKSNLGSMAKPLHVGHAARNGLLAALLAADGFTANADAFEHRQGFFEVFNGPGTYSVERILEKWGEPWDVAMPGIAIKQHPCCLSVQSAVDLVLDLVRRQDVRPEDVARIESLTSARRLAHTDRPHPRSALDAKLSIQYALARAVIDRKVALEHFEGEAYREPVVQRMMQRIDARAFAHEPPEGNDSGAEIRITLRDGTTRAGVISRPVGHEPGVPLAPSLLKAKFDDCAARLLPRARAESVYAVVQEFERLTDIGQLTAMLASGQPARAGGVHTTA